MVSWLGSKVGSLPTDLFMFDRCICFKQKKSLQTTGLDVFLKAHSKKLRFLKAHSKGVKEVESFI